MNRVSTKVMLKGVPMIEELIKIRHYLHNNPELSKQEKETAAFIEKQLQKTNPDKIITGVGGYGIVVFYEGYKSGKTIGIRVDMDGLPITESNTFSYKSSKIDVSHACGHDGHTAIGLGVAKYISKNRNQLQGTVAILFQPAEETGTGANDMLNDTKFEGINFDYIFALHNLPGFNKNSLIIRKGVFASSSIGIKVYLQGATSHAGHPEMGNSPVRAMTALMNGLNDLPQMSSPIHRPSLVTIIHARLGEVAFGTTPGYSEVMATYRAHYDEDLDKMKSRTQKIVAGISSAYDLSYEIEWVEYFPALTNNTDCVDMLKDIGNDLKLPILERDHPFAWSEDFACFTQRYQGAFFGIGAGMDYPQVHSTNYDFPDELIKTGLEIFLELIKRYTNSCITNSF